MANLSECYIEFQGNNKSLDDLHNCLLKKNFDFFDVDSIVEIKDNMLAVNGMAKRQLNLQKLADEICKKHKVTASGYDAESGDDFFIKFKIDEEGGIYSDKYDYICEESILAFGEDYIACLGDCCYAGDSKSALKQLRSLETFKNFTNFTKEEFESFFISYTESEVKSPEEIIHIKNVLETMPKIGESTINSATVVLINKNTFLCEAETEGKKTRILTFNTKLKEWNEDVLEDIELHTFDYKKLKKRVINLPEIA